ncbi:MAG: YggS family pyridoxal phosphate-dependent enzyme [Deltaproteobacteria bacterium]|jgi:pyridoxal phosphate enzyme (YggS family)|nr:YggS family pyridoxal phosphate-dependent enzyme [Deltaproteobacteria bacterium]
MSYGHPGHTDQSGGAVLRRSLELVLARLELALESSGRARDAACLVAVSKWHGPSQILLAAEHWRKLGGRPVFGENYVQEALAKQAALTEGDPARQCLMDWHFTGRAQSNKARFLAGRFGLIHTLDSLTLARNLQRCLEKSSHRQKALVQVNIGREKTKAGVEPGELEPFMRALRDFNRIDILGLMCMPPYAEEAEAGRPYFIRLRQMRDRMEELLGIKLPHLSMGMSHDFEIAVAEGATLVRVGTDIFGPRPPA